MRFTRASLVALALPAAFASAEPAEEQGVLSDDQLAHLLPLEHIPSLGFGTWNIAAGSASDAVAAALEAGYRHIDCASAYDNQKEVGQGIAAGAEKAGLKRHEYWVTSKLWNTAHAAEDVPKALNQTLSDLGLEYVDLYLMHWPVAEDEVGGKTIDYLDTWTAMAALPKSQARNIGVSNFSPAQLTALVAAHPLSKPYLHQYETHPYLPQPAFLHTHETLNIRVTAYSPLGDTNPTYDPPSASSSEEAPPPPLLSHPAITAIAAARDCTPAQVALAWNLRRGVSAIPKAAQADHMAENLATDVSKCVGAEDVAELARVLPTRRFNNPSKAWKVSLFEGLEGVDVAHQTGADETVLEAAEELLEEAARWGMMEMWQGVKGMWWFVGEMLGDDGY